MVYYAYVTWEQETSKHNQNNYMEPEETTTGNAEPEVLSYGQKAVGINFNPGGHPKVNEIKELYARIIDLLDEQRTHAGHSEKGRILSVAITEAQTAQMWAVKGVTWSGE